MAAYFTADRVKLLLSKLTYEKAVYLGLGWFLCAHYKAQVIAYVTAILGG